MLRASLLIILFLVACSAGCTDESNWSWQFGQGYFAYFGTSAGASDNADVQDVRVTGRQYWYVGTFHEPGVDGWTGDTGFYSQDVRAPLALAVGQKKTWRFYMWSDYTHSSDHLELMWGWYRPAAPAFDKMEYRLTYVREAQGIDGGSVPVGTSIVLNQYQQGTWAFPVYKTDDGRTGYMFELTATVIPEPSSLLALGAGGLGLLGAALRRRGRAATGSRHSMTTWR